MATRLLPTLLAALSLSIGTVYRPARVEAASQQESDGPGYSAQRVVTNVRENPAPRLTFDRQVSLATFRVSVEQHRVMLSFQEQFQKEFALTDFQRQSQEWYAKCCWINLLHLPQWADKLDRARRRRELPKLREQIAGELAQIEANKKK